MKLSLQMVTGYIADIDRTQTSALCQSEIIITSFPKPRLISIKFRFEFDKFLFCCVKLGLHMYKT